MMNVQEIEVELIDPPVWNSRTIPDPEADAGLRRSMGSEGLKEPIKVRKNGDRYLLIFGSRRLNSAQALSWTSIPAIVEEQPSNLSGTASALQAMVDNVIENLARKDLSTFDVARALAELRAPGGETKDGLPLVAVIEKTGLSKGYISNLVVTYQKLDPSIKEHWQNEHKNAQLSFLRELVNVEPEKQKLAWTERLKLTSVAATEAPEPPDEDDDDEDDEGPRKAPLKAEKYHIEFARYNKLVRTLASKKVPGSGLAVQALKYLVGKQTKIAGVIEDPTTDD